MATPRAIKRLTREYKALEENPPPFIIAHPSEDNILKWHYVITGPPETPYEGGQYHGTLTFAHDYPFKPPAIRMITPSGRFEPNFRLCLSMSDYHPQTWNPTWSVATILNGLLSFMTSNEITTGSITTTEERKKAYAKASRHWNATMNPEFIKQFPELVQEYFHPESAGRSASHAVSVPVSPIKSPECAVRQRKPGDENSPVTNMAKPVVEPRKPVAQPVRVQAQAKAQVKNTEGSSSVWQNAAVVFVVLALLYLIAALP